MSAGVVSYPRALLAGLVAGLTAWACMLAWSPLLERPDHELPLLLVAVVVGVTGGTARWARVPGLGVLLLHFLLTGAVVLVLTTGTQWSEFWVVLSESTTSARTYAAPVPPDVPPVWPLFLVVGAVSAVVVDLLALSWRRVALSALVVLALHLVPANLAVEVRWWVFCLVAAGFLTLLHLDADDLVLRWGSLHARRRESTGAAATLEPVAARAPRAGAQRAGAQRAGVRGVVPAVRIGVVAVVLAMGLGSVLTALVPDSPIRPWTPGAGSTGAVSLTSPLVDMRRDLDRGADISLLTVDSPRRPTYLRHAVLPEFDGTEWSAGERSAVALPRDGSELPLVGVDPLLKRTERELVLTASYALRSRWLPLMPLTSGVEVSGDWRWDRQTTDVASYDTDLTTAGETWTTTGVDLEYNRAMLEEAPSGVGEVPSVFSSLPEDLPRSVRTWAREVTADETNRFDQALALQDWFRSEFDYSLDQVETVDNEALAEFLSPEGRVGYCEQFAAAMAVMARTLDIPSRVAVGFLEPRRVGVTQWEFSSHDLHAWPELYFPGSGWVRFEPTPASRAPGVPDYTEEQEPAPTTPSPSASESAEPTTAPTRAPDRQEPTPTTAADDTDDGGVEWGTVLRWTAALTLLAVVVVTPRWLRRRRRAGRLAVAEVEELWEELRDSAVDLGHTWPTGRSPRATGAVVAEWLGAEDDGGGSTLSGTGAAEQLERLVVGVEEQRFARPGSGGVMTAATTGSEHDLRALVEALSARRGRLDRWRAEWWPRSLMRRPRS
ncbi:transglutaminase domain-containing protein [Nocardioides sp. Y6]|uniref:Transglutaminase domain-containing protein n=1 Tax=Nocardioides malaquae TaxID=2773426 RepID=A0ABR9RNU3_9ACTN|nr:DUF3488 and transglutaminase-like domain-containing protein [Nocardioides malaquae]MBE7323239.1 transglutaminase domain-containing protein [Nocardioides malaquae]